MIRMTQLRFYRLALLGICVFSLSCIVASRPVLAVNSAVWESSQSLIDTTNYLGLTQYYWFANANNTAPVTGAPMNQNEVKNLPSWLHFETNPAFIGKDDSGANNDGTFRTGFSFTENPPNGATSIGGQAGFNTLTLPNGVNIRSGEAVDSLSATGNTSSMTAIRVLPGAPDSIRLWMVTDHGAGANFHGQARMRVNLRDTNGPPLFDVDTDQQEAEALPTGVRIGQTPVGINGVADAWAFRLSGLNANDVITLRPTSLAGSLPGFAGFMVQVIPEPSSMVLLAMAALGMAIGRRRG